MKKTILLLILISILTGCGNSQKEKVFKAYNEGLKKELIIRLNFNENTKCDSLIALKIDNVDLDKEYYSFSAIGATMKKDKDVFLIKPNCGQDTYKIYINYVVDIETNETKQVLQINLKDFLIL